MSPLTMNTIFFNKCRIILLLLSSVLDPIIILKLTFFSIEKNGIQSAINSMKEPLPRSRLGRGLRVSKGRGNQGGWSGAEGGSGSPISGDKNSPGRI